MDETTETLHTKVHGKTPSDNLSFRKQRFDWSELWVIKMNLFFLLWTNSSVSQVLFCTSFLVSVPINTVSDNVCSINVIKTAHFNRNRNLSLNLTKWFYAGHEAPKAAPNESVIPRTLPLLQPPSVDTCGIQWGIREDFLNLYLAMKWKSLDLEYALWGVPWAEISSAPGANSTQKRFTWVQKENLLPDLSCGALHLLLWGLPSLWTVPLLVL